MPLKKLSKKCFDKIPHECKGDASGVKRLRNIQSKSMPFKILADIVVLIHFLWIVFLIFGAPIGLKSKPFRFLHISGLIFAIFLQIMGWYCPLTYLEVWLRSMHDPSTTYPGSFITHYIERLVYIELPQNLIFALTIILCLLNAYIYFRRQIVRRKA